MYTLKKLTQIILFTTSINFCSLALAQEPDADWNDPKLTIGKLEQNLGQLFLKLERAKGQTEKIQFLESFHRALRGEIRKRSSRGDRDDLYWRAVDMDVTIMNLLDQKCSDLKTVLLFSEQNPVTNDDGKISAETEKALELARTICH